MRELLAKLDSLVRICSLPQPPIAKSSDMIEALNRFDTSGLVQLFTRKVQAAWRIELGYYRYQSDDLLFVVVGATNFSMNGQSKNNHDARL